MSNREVSYIWYCIQSAAAAAAAALCCCTAVVAAAVLLLPADVRHRNLNPVFSFYSFKRDNFLVHPLEVLSHLRPRLGYILGNYGHARSQGGR